MPKAPLRNLLRVLAGASLLACLPLAARAQETPGEDTAAAQNGNWVDSSYQDIDSRAEALANWVDGFFGHPREVQDSANSMVRLRLDYEWDEQDGDDLKPRANGRLYLPSTSDRLSLVFQGEEGNFEDEFYDPAMASDGDSAAGIQYELESQGRARAFLFAGVKSGPKAKLGARYRYTLPFMQRNRLRFSEEVFWVGGDGFGSLTRVDFDRGLSDSTLLRWANKAEIREDSNGWEWNTRLAWIHRLGKRQAFRVFGFVRGDSDPELLRARGLGMGYRRNFYREWLYYEVEPRYAWRKRPRDTEREGVAMIQFRLEAVIGDF